MCTKPNQQQPERYERTEKKKVLFNDTRKRDERKIFFCDVEMPADVEEEEEVCYLAYAEKEGDTNHTFIP